MNDRDLHQRLNALITTLASPAGARSATEDSGGSAAGGDVQRIGTAQVDALLRRLSMLTAALGSRKGQEWDDVDQLAARLLLGDLAAIASTTRALNGLTPSRLEAALTDLRAAGVDVERAVQEASRS